MNTLENVQEMIQGKIPASKITSCLLSLFLTLFLVGCSIKKNITNQYGLQSYAVMKIFKYPAHHSILLTTPEATAGYTTEEMRYTVKPYELDSFAHNAWYSPPAEMLLPLMVKSLQQSGYFYAVASTSNAEPTDYRIDTQLLELKQNFLKTPAQIDFVVKVVLTHVADNRIIGSRMMEYHLNCREKTPFGGVVAANEATKRFTADLTDFIMHHLV